MPNDPLILLGLKPPFTDLRTQEVLHWTDVTIDINGKFSGVLRVPTVDAKRVIREVFASDAEVGSIHPTGVDWKISLALYDKPVVVDDDGGIHIVRDLES